MLQERLVHYKSYSVDFVLKLRVNWETKLQGRIRFEIYVVHKKFVKCVAFSFHNSNLESGIRATPIRCARLP